MLSLVKKLWAQYGIFSLIGAAIILYVLWRFIDYLGLKGMVGGEGVSGMGAQYSASNGGSSVGGLAAADQNIGQNASFASAQGMQTSMPGLPMPCNSGSQNIQNPSDLLPRDTNSEWSQFNPQGKGEFADVNMLKAGWALGINTIGQSMRNPSYDIRSEPPNPTGSPSIWNQSTMEPNFMRVPLEIGQGPL